jgi:hypothetical protein
MSTHTAPPGAAPASAAAVASDLAAYRAALHDGHQQWLAVLARNAERLARRAYSLHWLDTDRAAWGARARPSNRGLTFADINAVPPYGDVPARAAYRNFAARGSVRDPYAAEMPTLDDYVLLDRHEVWADNVVSLYEEAKARQWNATRDIPWHELEPLPDDLEKATCQLCTVLTEVEFIAGDFPAKWLYRTPQDFLEVKSFLATQAMDEARHQEVFRKRAIAGGGLLHAAPGFEWALKAILEAPTHTMGTFLLNLLSEGLVLSIFRSGEMIAKTHVDKEIFRRCLQDEARHVAYGVLQLAYHLDHAADRAAALEAMHGFADLGEPIILTAFTEPALVEPIAVLLGGGVADIDRGMDAMGQLWHMFIEEYLQRCARAGFDRRGRCMIPAHAPWVSA